MNDNISPGPIRKHHALVTGQVMFRHPQAPADSTPMSLLVNSVIISDSMNFSLAAISYIHNQLIESFRGALKDENGQELKAQIVSVVIMSISQLGYMTHAEFNNLPQENQDERVGVTTESTEAGTP